MCVPSPSFSLVIFNLTESVGNPATERPAVRSTAALLEGSTLTHHNSDTEHFKAFSNSFLQTYRLLSPQHLDQAEFLVDKKQEPGEIVEQN